jgi:TonB family protein
MLTRNQWRKFDGLEGRWAKWVLGSGLVHAALVGVCLLIQPVSGQFRPVLRVRLVEETGVPRPDPVAAEPQAAPVPVKVLTPPRSSPRRTPPASIVPVVERVPVAATEAERMPTAAVVADPIDPPPAPTAPPELPSSKSPGVPVAVSPPAALAAVSIPGSSAAEGLSDAPGSRGASEDAGVQQAGGSSGSSTASQLAATEARGVFLLAGRGNGTGVGDGTGTGSGNGLNLDVGRGEGTGGSASNGNGAGTVASRGGGAPFDGTSTGSMLRAIRSQIERARVYPDAARRQGMQGIVEIRFRIGPEGAVEAVEVARSSGHALLDQVSTDTVRRAGPYPRVAGWIRIPLTYRLDQ